MATKSLFKVGDGEASFEILAVDGVVQMNVGDSGQGSAITSITDNTTGTADGTLEDATATYSQTIVNNNFAEVAAKIEAILDALRAQGIIAS